MISGFFQPKGLAGDMGGGSLEVAEVVGDRVGERMVCMPLGALPVKAMLAEGADAAKKRIDAILDASLPPLLTDPVFYAIGGGWRALARVHIALTGAPISVVHGYDVAAEEVRALAKRIARMTPAEVAALPDVPSRRVDTLPAAAAVMHRVLKKLQPERVVFSVLGLREGWLYAQLDAEEQYRDPLLEGAQAIGLPAARVPEFSAALARWTDELFPGETQGDRRLRLAVCALTDIAWRDHEKVRAIESFRRLLQFPFIGISHPERAFLAVAIMARYGGSVDETVRAATKDLLSPSQLRRAEILGRVLLLGHRFSASVPEILDAGADPDRRRRGAARDAERRAGSRQRRGADAAAAARAGERGRGGGDRCRSATERREGRAKVARRATPARPRRPRAPGAGSGGGSAAAGRGGRRRTGRAGARPGSSGR